jgi:hypothetical protein
MKKLKTITGLALVLASFGCGDHKKKGFGGPSIKGSSKHYSGDNGKCTYTNSDTGMVMCMELSYSGLMQSDPKDDANSAARKGCNDASNSTVTTSFQSVGSCPSDRAVGFCSIKKTVSAGSESYTHKGVIVFSTPTTESEARTGCYNASGTFSTSRP